MPTPAHPRPALSFSAVGLTWPDGTVAFDGLDLLVSPGRSGLVGANGSGKSTLLRLAAGALTPTAGSVSVAGEVGYLPQDLTLDRASRVDDVLGVGTALRALRRLDAGSGEPDDLEAVGDQWDVEERVVAELERLGLDPSVLDRRLGNLSGGEVVRLGLARLLLRRPDVLLLDEPTNNLDAPARARLYDVLEAWPRTLLVVSHDRELLERVDRIGELRDGAVRWYGGGFDRPTRSRSGRAGRGRAGGDHRPRGPAHGSRPDRVEAERRARAPQAVRRQDVRRSEREPQGGQGLLEEPVGAEVRRVVPARSTTSGSSPPADKLDEAEARLREDRTIRVDLPGTEAPRGRVVLTTDDLVIRTGARVDLDLRGPDRIAVVGPNGAGKTTLLETVAGTLPPRSGDGAHARADRAAPPAARPPGPGALRRRERRAPGAGGRAQPDPRAAGPLPVPRRRRRAAGRHAVGRRAVPGHAGRAAARGPGPSAADARRADQQPRPRVVRRARGRARGVPRGAAGGQPRRAVPRGDRRAPPPGAQAAR